MSPRPKPEPESDNPYEFLESDFLRADSSLTVYKEDDSQETENYSEI